MKRKITTILATFLLTLGVIVVYHPGVASAALSSCPADRLCLYNGANGSGVPDLYSASSLADCENVRAGTDNSASSLYNRTAFYITLKKGTGCSGASSLFVSPGGIIYNLATPCCAWNNSISSMGLGEF